MDHKRRVNMEQDTKNKSVCSGKPNIVDGPKSSMNRTLFPSSWELFSAVITNI